MYSPQKILNLKGFATLRVAQKIEGTGLANYIRHSIHHPENVLNDKFTEELRQSIEYLRKLKYA